MARVYFNRVNASSNYIKVMLIVNKYTVAGYHQSLYRVYTSIIMKINPVAVESLQFYYTY